MIPKLAIEKAIEGGWQVPHVETEDELPAAIRFYLHGNEWAKIALDPTFWQALGKSLRGEIETHIYIKRVHAGKPHLGNVTITRPNRYSFNWRKHAHRFYDLILQGKDTEPFWQELL